jgi:tetratricopeptide (TPR) repeat protein
LSINKKIGDTQYIAKNLNNLGEIYRFKGDLDKSLDYYQAAHSQFLNLGNKQDILHTDHNIGLILHARGDFKGAKEKLLRSLELNKDLGNDIDKSDTTFHLIPVLIDLGELELAKGYLIELNTLVHSHPQNKIISLRSLIANSLILKKTSQKNDIEKAKRVLKEIVDEEIIFHELTVTAMIYLCQILADELIQNQETDILSDLNTYTNRLQSLVDEHHSNAMTIEIYILQSRFAIIKGKLQKALRFLEQAQAIAQKRNLSSLTKRLEEEIDNFHAEYEKWLNLIQRNAPMYERLEQARIADYVKEAQRLVVLFN